MKRFLIVIPLTILLGLSSSCQDKTTKAEREKVMIQAQTEARNKEIVRQIFSAIDKSDFERLKELLSDDFTLKAPGLSEPLGPNGLFQAVKKHYAAFPDWRHVIEDAIAEGDKVAVRLTQYGTHSAEYERIPATGNKVTMPALHLVTVVNGKIKDWYAVEDYLGLNMQLGMALQPIEAKKLRK
jgi:predicted ester cyclase